MPLDKIEYPAPISGLISGLDGSEDDEGIIETIDQLSSTPEATLDSLISMQQILFFLRILSCLYALLEPTPLFIFVENSHLHDY